MFKVEIEAAKRKSHVEELRAAHRELLKELEEGKDPMKMAALKGAIPEYEKQILKAEEVLKDKQSLRKYLDEDKAAVEEKRGRVSEQAQSKILEYEISVAQLSKDLLKELDDIAAEIQEESDNFERAAMMCVNNFRWRSKVFQPVNSTVREVESLNRELMHRYQYR